MKNDQVITAINGALTGLAAFILLTPSSKVLDSGESVTGIISKDWTAGQGMICAILIGFLVGYIYSLCEKDISIKMPDGVPSGVADSFSSLLPTGIIITICAIIYAICHFIFNTTFAELIYSVIQIPFTRNYRFVLWRYYYDGCYVFITGGQASMVVLYVEEFFHQFYNKYGS